MFAVITTMSNVSLETLTSTGQPPTLPFNLQAHLRSQEYTHYNDGSKKKHSEFLKVHKITSFFTRLITKQILTCISGDRVGKLLSLYLKLKSMPYMVGMGQDSGESLVTTKKIWKSNFINTYLLFFFYLLIFKDFIIYLFESEQAQAYVRKGEGQREKNKHPSQPNTKPSWLQSSTWGSIPGLQNHEPSPSQMCN